MTDKRSIGPVTTASTAGTALGIITAYTAAQLGLELPEPVQNAVTALLTIGLSLLGGWLVRPGTGTRRK